MQARWVQVAEKARKSVSPTRTTITGSLPKRTILKPLSTNSGSLIGPASTWLVAASATCGGLRKRTTG